MSKKILSIFLFLLLLACGAARAQPVVGVYAGGAGRGDGRGSSVKTILGVQAGYLGGSGRGDAAAASPTAMLGAAVSYRGGAGRGDAASSASEAAAVGLSIYAGGAGRGDQYGASVSTILGVAAGYLGGSGRGDVAAASTTAMLGLAVSYLGGPGRGDAFAGTAAAAMGLSIFAGGPGRGDVYAASAPTALVGCGPGRRPVPVAAVTYHPTFGMSDGSAQATYTGGAEPISLVWSDDTPGALLSQVSAGDYTVTATDANGCSATASVTLSPTPRGRIIWSANSQQGVLGVAVRQTGDGSGERITGADGLYAFDPILTGTHFTLKPAKTSGKLQGITVADASRIQRHVAFAPPLETPYELIAADVNGSKSISSLDAVLVSQCLLNNPIACNLWIASWRFVDAAHIFPNPLQPWVFPEKIDLYPGVLRAGAGLDFTGVKIGDVLNSGANPSSGSQALVIQVPDLQIKDEEVFSVPVRVLGYRSVAAYQFAFDFDPAVLSLEGVETPVGGLLDADHFGLSQAEAGELRVAYASPDAATLEEGAEIFRLHFRSRQPARRLSALLSLKEEALPAAAYDADLSFRPLLLQFDRATGIAAPAPADLSLTAQPNPAPGSTRVRFTLPESCTVRLRVFDTSGRIIQENLQTCAAGLHERPIDLPLPGVYLIEMQTPGRVGRVRVVSAGRL
jgi:hypothetical protein